MTEPNEKRPMFAILYDIQGAQEEDRNHGQDDTFDARLTFDLGGTTRTVTGLLGVLKDDDEDIAVFYRTRNGGVAEIPAFFRRDRLVVVEWACNDYDGEIK